MRPVTSSAALLAACFWLAAAQAQVTLVPPADIPRLFGGAAASLNPVWRNQGDRNVDIEVRALILQTTSATAVRFAEVPWKRLQVLPGQTIIESATLDFPAVNAETPFLIQWLGEGTNLLGRTEVLVYPTNLLAELKPLSGETPGVLGVFDPLNQLKPILRSLRITFADLEVTALETFRGNLAILGPFATAPLLRQGMAAQVGKLAAKGVAIVWLQPPPGPRDNLQPSFRTVPFGHVDVVIAQAHTVTILPASPQAQLNLIHFCRLARHPVPPRLPDPTPQS
jgi:hypothetical protein